MTSVTTSAAWNLLQSHYTENGKDFDLNELFATDASRFHLFSRTFKARPSEPILFDFSKNLINKETFNLLVNLIKESKVEEWRNKMFNGTTRCVMTSLSWGLDLFF
jgi:glucose-6-phosphate isomerase